MGTPVSALSAAGSALGGASDLINAVGSLLPTTTTASGHTETKASANSDTRSGELNVGKSSTIGTENSSSTGTNKSILSGGSNETGTNKTSSTTSGSSNEAFSGQDNVTTTQTMLTNEGAMRIVNMMLQGTGGIPGLQETVSGERNAGVFNSSTNSLLTSNLVSTIAGEVARLSAPTVASQKLGATNTQTTNNTSTLMDAITSAVNSMSQNSSGTESKTGQSNSSQDVMNIVMALAQQLTDQSSESTTDNKTKTKTKKFPCYITTAVVEGLGMEDDCEELQTLRAFRDTWLKTNKPLEIDQYHMEAPGIVEAMHALHEIEFSDLIHELYYAYIIPAVTAIQTNSPEIAYQIYKAMVIRAKEVLKLEGA